MSTKNFSAPNPHPHHVARSPASASRFATGKNFPCFNHLAIVLCTHLHTCKHPPAGGSSGTVRSSADTQLQSTPPNSTQPEQFADTFCSSFVPSGKKFLVLAPSHFFNFSLLTAPAPLRLCYGSATTQHAA